MPVDEESLMKMGKAVMYNHSGAQGNILLLSLRPIILTIFHCLNWRFNQNF